MKLSLFHDTDTNRTGAEPYPTATIAVQGRPVVDELVLTAGDYLQITEAEYTGTGLTLLLSFTDLAAAYIGNTAAAQLPVYAISTSNITSISGSLTVDGVTPPNGSRVALAGQTTGSQNGFYVVNDSGAWTRTYLPPLEGQTFEVLRGTRFAGTLWIVATTGTITVGTTAVALRRVDGKLITYALSNASHVCDGLAGRQYVVIAGLTAGRTVTLPSAVTYGDGQEVVVQKDQVTTAFSINVSAPGSETLDGGTTAFAVIAAYECRTFRSVGGNWLST